MYVMKTILKITVCAVCLTVAYLGSRQAEENVSELVNSNVEALATGEHPIPAYCYGSGSVDRYRGWVEMKIEGSSLE